MLNKIVRFFFVNFGCHIINIADARTDCPYSFAKSLKRIEIDHLMFGKGVLLDKFIRNQSIRLIMRQTDRQSKQLSRFSFSNTERFYTIHSTKENTWNLREIFSHRKQIGVRHFMSFLFNYVWIHVFPHPTISFNTVKMVDDLGGIK